MKNGEMQIFKTSLPKVKPDLEKPENLGFGKFFTDHMFVAQYSKAQKGWGDYKITPYASLALDPAASSLHYGQALFEGMKAFYQTDGSLVLVRPQFNYQRMRQGAERLCMQMPSEDVFLAGLSELVKIDRDWIPRTPGASLYLRPTLVATEAFLGVRPAEEFLFFIIACPVGSYFQEGQGFVKIWVEREYVRAAPGGLGSIKAAANYAGSLKAAERAKKMGYSQVLWLDVNRQNIEEVGTMNVFFKLGDEVVTPSLSGTILAGGTRDLVISWLRQNQIKVTERPVAWEEIKSAHQSGLLQEAFGTGTAAVISPIGVFGFGDNENLVLPLARDDGKSRAMDSLSTKLYQALTDIQYGRSPDSLNCIYKIL